MITIVVLNWNGADDTLRCLESLGNLKGERPNILVVDNGSEDDSVPRIREAIHGLSQTGDLVLELLEGALPEEKVFEGERVIFGLIKGASNLGFGGGVNLGLRVALRDPRMTAAWILNNDTLVDQDALKALRSSLDKEPDAGIIGSTLLYLDQPDLIQAVGGRYNPWFGKTSHVLGQKPYFREACASIDPKTLDYIVGASLCIRREVLERVGLLSEEYFLYFEELDFVERMKRLMPEMRLGYAAESLVYHKEGGSTEASDLGGKKTSIATDYFFLTSRIRFARRFYPFQYPLVHLLLLGVLLNRIRRGHWVSAWLTASLFFGRTPSPPRSYLPK